MGFEPPFGIFTIYTGVRLGFVFSVETCDMARYIVMVLKFYRVIRIDRITVLPCAINKYVRLWYYCTIFMCYGTGTIKNVNI